MQLRSNKEKQRLNLISAFLLINTDLCYLKKIGVFVFPKSYMFEL